MANEGLEHKKALEEIYLILAEFFKYPTEEFYYEVTEGLTDQRLAELTQFVRYPVPKFSFKNRFNSFYDMKQEFIRCFMGVERPYAPPVESVYKVWTTDPTFSLPIANSKGYFFGDSALHLKYLYEQFQLEIPEEFSNMPDHLTLLLEFLAFLIKEGTDDQVKQLLMDHFDWLNDFRLKLSKVRNSDFYLNVTDVLIDILDYENQIRASV
ncbi:TorD/DmsD family molecular chaperone [Tepidibacillus sp. LV47]|uniref:TorD/DmsD family molecular chaperone n=1 Tax=Tepidibacillus sp. LV47 TaxID=3398228 RepID=UPI003AAABE9D